MGPSVQAYLKAVELLIELASLQTAFLTLDEAIKTTNRRVNALDNVVVPRLENTISYIKASPSASSGLLCRLTTWTMISHYIAGAGLSALAAKLHCHAAVIKGKYAEYCFPAVMPHASRLQWRGRLQSWGVSLYLLMYHSVPIKLIMSMAGALKERVALAGGAGRAGARGVLPAEEGAGEEEARRSHQRCPGEHLRLCR